jgi:hypothetical protein
MGNWLKTGIWTSFTIADLFSEWNLPLPETLNLIGLEKIIQALLVRPGVLAYAIVCCVLIWSWAKGELQMLVAMEPFRRNSKQKPDRSI